MNIFLTGHRGKIGNVIATDLRALGHAIVGYDRQDGDDILDVSSLEMAIQGCEAVIHLAALLGLPDENPSEIMAVNLQGTWNVLTTAAMVNVKRLIYMSSVNALGVFKGERKPDYFPLDDMHPCYPGTPYGISKRLSEEMCRLWSKNTGIPVICLRPPGVWTSDTYHAIHKTRQACPSYEWYPYWEYGAFIDVRDLSEASIRALTSPVQEFACVLVAAADITTSGKSSKELVDFIHPDIKWRGGEEFQDDPYHSLIVTDTARRILDWEPQYTWRAFIEQESIISWYNKP